MEIAHARVVCTRPSPLLRRAWKRGYSSVKFKSYSSSIINSSSSNSSSLAKKDPQRHPSCPHRHKASVEISAAAATLPSRIQCMWVILTNFNMPELLTCFDEKSQDLCRKSWQMYWPYWLKNPNIQGNFSAQKSECSDKLRVLGSTVKINMPRCYAHTNFVHVQPRPLSYSVRACVDY